jgi:hypothetical protein
MGQFDKGFQRLIQETAKISLQQSVAADVQRLRHLDSSSCPRILTCTGANGSPTKECGWKRDGRDLLDGGKG